MAPADHTTSDGDLLARAAAGDREAVSALLSRHGPTVRRRLQGRIAAHWKGVLDEDDVMQVTYLEAFVRIASFQARGDPGPSFLAWLTQIAENNLRDAIRGLERAKRPDPRKRVRAANPQDSYVSLVEVLGVTSATPSRHAAGREAARAIEAALERLPPDYRAVIRMYDLEGREIADLCRELKRTSGAVYMLRARAHDRLREILGSESQFFSTPT